MSFSADWSRWIKASVAKHFAAALPSIHLFMEGEVRKSAEQATWIELRVDGPRAEEVTRGSWQLEVEVSVLCCTPVQRDVYFIERLVGMVSAVFAASIPVYRYGDAGTLLDCLTRRTFKVNHYGQIDPKTPVVQATVEGSYYVRLEE